MQICIPTPAPAFQSWDKNVGSMHQTPSSPKYKRGSLGTRLIITLLWKILIRLLLKRIPSLELKRNSEVQLYLTTNQRSYTATLDEFPDLFPAFQKPDNQFATSSYHTLKSIKFPKKTNVWFSRYKQTSGFQVE